MSSQGEGALDLDRVPVQIVVPLDPEAMPIGGIATFVRGFVKYAPQDFALELIGMSDNRPLGRWRDATLDDRVIRHLPVARSMPQGSRIPRSAAFTAGLVRYARKTGGFRLRQFHRPATSLPLLLRRGPRSQVIHLTASGLSGAGSESHWRRAGWLLRAVEQATLRGVDRVYVVNEEATAEYRARYPELAERIMHVPNWVDDDLFQAPDDDQRAAVRRTVREELTAAPTSHVVLFAGRLETVKDPLLALRACSRLMESGRDLHLVVAGEGALGSALHLEAEQLGVGARVHALGSVARRALARLMAASDTLLITSLIETGPTVGLEAMATGLPIVTIPVGTVGRLVKESFGGAIIGERSPERVAQTLELVLDGDATALRAASLAAVDPFRARSVLPLLYRDARRLVRDALVAA